MAELDGVPRLHRADRVQLAVDVHAVGALVVDHLPAAVLQHEARVLAAHRLVIDGDVVVLAAPDLHLGAHEVELLAADVAGEADQARHLVLGQVARLDRRSALREVRDADDRGCAARARGRRGGGSGQRLGHCDGRELAGVGRRRLRGRDRLLRTHDGAGRDGARADPGLQLAGRRHDGFDLALDAEIVVTDLDQVAFLDAVAVDAQPVVGAQILDDQRAVVLDQPGVPAGDVPFGQLDGVAILTADRDLFPYEGDDGLAPLVVLDDELHVFLRRDVGCPGVR